MPARSTTRAELVEADVARWRPQAPVDLILANASLQWLGDHERLLPDLLRHCRVLAVQLPDNFDAPSHRLLRETMASGPRTERLAGMVMGDRILRPERYLAVLRAHGAAAAYPVDSQGAVLFPFGRLFFIAQSTFDVTDPRLGL